MAGKTSSASRRRWAMGLPAVAVPAAARFMGTMPRQEEEAEGRASP